MQKSYNVIYPIFSRVDFPCESKRGGPGSSPAGPVVKGVGGQAWPFMPSWPSCKRSRRLSLALYANNSPAGPVVQMAAQLASF